MAFLEWRKFNFFDLKRNVDEGKVAKALNGTKVTTISTWSNSTSSVVILGTSSGHIHIVSRSWQVQTFQAYEKSIILSDTQYPALLVTIGEDEDNVPSMKVWNLAKLTKTGIPTCLRTYKQQSQMIRKPTCISIGENGQLLAVGYDNGTVDLHRGDITRDRIKVKTLIASNGEIYGLSFKAVTKCVNLFISSSKGVLVYTLTGRDRENKLTLDKTECNPGYCSLPERSNEDHSDFMVGRTDAVYCYTADGRGPCYAVEGEKLCLEWFRSHLVILSRPLPPTNTTTSSVKLQLTILDIQNKFIVFSAPVDDFEFIFAEWGACYVLASNNEIWHLDEKDLQSKLNLLFKKNLYDVAIRIAKKQQYDSDSLSDIFRQYGDHLYAKGDHASAVEQYIKTIGCLEPSYVIRRFLGSRHIDYLTSYLQALHRQGYATGDHTTLLLNCFTRLDKPEQLANFLKAGDRELDFDVDVAIQVCRNASIDQALALAKKHGKHDLCLKILVEDMKVYDQGLEYIECLEFDDAMKYMSIYGTILLQMIPVPSTDFLKRLCTDYRVKNKLLVDVHMLDGGVNSLEICRANPEQYIHLFQDNSEYLINFLEYLIKTLTTCDTLVYNTLLEQYLQSWSRAGSRDVDIIKQKILELLKDSNACYDEHHILILCHTHKFYAGMLYLYEKVKMYQLIIRHNLKHKDYGNVLDICRRLGSDQPSLWLQALWGVCRNQDAPKEIVAEMLQFIAKEKLQSPLQVLDCLSIPEGPTLGTARQYFIEVFQQEKYKTKEVNELIVKYRADSERIKKNIANLQDGPIEFRGARCAACNHTLELPSVHFLCHHAYHQHCFQSFSENESECPACLPGNKHILDIARAQTNSRSLHESFHKGLEQSEDPFLHVADYFSRGIFSKVTTPKPQKEKYIDISDDGYSDIIVKKIPEEKDPHTIYGPGAEAKIRLMEGNKQPVFERPISEGRMRQREMKINSYNTTLEANISRIENIRINNTNPKASNNQYSTTSYTNNVSNIKLTPNNKITDDLDESNPFREDYDESKNPFADDSEAHSENPFNDDDYDKNLNPFET